MTIALVFSLSCAAFAAASEPAGISGFGEIQGSKTAECTGDGAYKVTLSVPGVDTTVSVDERLYNEVIIMVDGSDSQSDRTGNFSALKSTLKSVGDKLLTEDGHTHLTLMGFGFSAKTVMSISTPAELDSLLAALNQDDLLYGVSATNCEVGFTWVTNYLNCSANLNEAVVIFTSDGQTNADEEPWDWSSWKEHTEWYYKGMSAPDIIATGIQAQKTAVLGGADFLDATKTLYRELCEAYVSEPSEEAIDAIGEAIAAEPVAWADAVWADMFHAYGLEYGENCTASSSEFEHALFEYTRKLDPNYEELVDMFLMLIMNYGKYQRDYYAGRTEYGFRAAEACDVLAGNAKVKNLYLVGYPGSIAGAHWMNPDATVENKVSKNEKVAFLSSTDFQGALSDLQMQVEATIVKTPISDPVVTDPMSKWVNFDPATLAIASEGETIWTYEKGWLIPEGSRPVSGDPIVVSNDPETGRPVISWKIKDGALILTDRFTLTYSVTMNTEAEGFVHGKEYPLNDPTDVTYLNSEGEKTKVDIEVPAGKTPAQSVTVNYYSYDTEEELKEPVTTKPVAKGSEYDVTSEHLKEIITEDGKEYVFIEATGDDETGILDGDKEVNLYYVEKPQYTVTVNYYLYGTNMKLADSVETDPEYDGSDYDVTECLRYTVLKDGEAYFYEYRNGDGLSGTLDGNKEINLYYVYPVYEPIIAGGGTEETEEPEAEPEEEKLEEPAEEPAEETLEEEPEEETAEEPAEETEELAEETEDLAEETEDLADPGTPLGNAPVLISTEDELEDMPEDPVPLADVPATGDSTGIWAVLTLAAAGLTAAYTVICRKKKSSR